MLAVDFAGPKFARGEKQLDSRKCMRFTCWSYDQLFTVSAAPEARHPQERAVVHGRRGQHRRRGRGKAPIKIARGDGKGVSVHAQSPRQVECCAELGRLTV